MADESDHWRLVARPRLPGPLLTASRFTQMQAAITAPVLNRKRSQRDATITIERVKFHENQRQRFLLRRSYRSGCTFESCRARLGAAAEEVRRADTTGGRRRSRQRDLS